MIRWSDSCVHPELASCPWAGHFTEPPLSPLRLAVWWVGVGPQGSWSRVETVGERGKAGLLFLWNRSPGCHLRGGER